MDRVPELQETLVKEASALLDSIEERLSMLRACGQSSEDLDEVEEIIEELRNNLGRA